MRAPLDPIGVRCPRCAVAAGLCCLTSSGRACRPHRARSELALTLAAHADPALDGHWPKRGPCLVCGTRGLDQRHRVIDAIADYLASGESAEEISEMYQVSPEAVQAVEDWRQRWGVS